MALTFASTNDDVDYGQPALIDDLPSDGTFSGWAWIYRTGSGFNKWIISQHTSGQGWFFNSDDQNLQLRVERASTATNYITSGNHITANAWSFVAFSYDEPNATEVRLYYGNLTTSVIEITTFSTNTNGSGAYTTANQIVAVGNEAGGTFPFIGSIARGGILDRVVTLGEFRQIQFAPLAQCNISGTQLLFDYHGTGTQADFSGNAYSGTVTGATASDHAPISPILLPDVSKQRVSAIAMTSTGNSFSGYGADETTDAAIYNTTGRRVTINVVDGSTSEHTHRDGTGSVTTVIGSVPISITVVDANGAAVENARVAVFDSFDNTQYMNELTNASGIASTTYTDSTPNAVTIRVRKNSSADSPRYVPISTPETITSDGLTTIIGVEEDINAA